MAVEQSAFIRLLILAILLTWALGLQWALWGADGSLAERRALEGQLAQMRERVDALRARNEAQAIEVRDFRDGLDAIEERARSEMGMIGKDEIFYQIVYSDSLPQGSSRHGGE